MALSGAVLHTSAAAASGAADVGRRLEQRPTDTRPARVGHDEQVVQAHDVVRLDGVHPPVEAREPEQLATVVGPCAEEHTGRIGADEAREERRVLLVVGLRLVEALVVGDQREHLGERVGTDARDLDHDSARISAAARSPDCTAPSM